MTCRDALEFLADYLDGSLPFGRKLSLNLHLSLCRHCRNYLENYKKAIEASRNAYDDKELCEELPEDLVKAILTTREHLDRVD